MFGIISLFFIYIKITELPNLYIVDKDSICQKLLYLNIHHIKPPKQIYYK